ncbi:MAG TPA: peptidyl-prolyl cis-trans isomerase [bacterium]|nr:peptidyl-prolyl cis-trans isomerase [bacterium]
MFLLLICFLTVGIVSAEEPKPAQAQPSALLPPVVAKVGDKDIRAVDFVRSLADTSGRTVLSRMVNDLLLEHEAGRRKIKISDSEVSARLEKIKANFASDEDFLRRLSQIGHTVETLKDQLRGELTQKKLLESEVTVSGADIEKYYEANREKLGKPEMVNIKMITVNTETEAGDILLALKAGADFDILAAAKSIDAATKEKGGDLGWITRDMLAADFAGKIFAMQEGGVSSYGRQDGKFNLIKIAEKKAAEPAKLDKSLKERIREALLENKTKEILPGFLQKLREKEKVEVYINLK